MKNIFKNKRNILIMMLSLVVIMGIGFAAYSQQLKINETSSIDSNWDVYIKSVDVKNTKGGATGNGTVDSKTAASLTTDLKYPGDNVIYNIIVANDGTIDALLEKINFSMEKENTVIKYYYSVDDEATWNEVTKDSENPYDVDLLANTTDEFQVKVEYDPTKTGTATEEQKSNKLTLNLDYVQKTGGGTVVPIETITIDELKESAVTTGDGLYIDNTEDGRYIYKGENPDNYITFNNELWRIMSIDKDETSAEDKWNLKIIRNESIGNMRWDEKGARPSSIHTYCKESSNYGCNAWAASVNLVNKPTVFTLYSPNGNPSTDTKTSSGKVGKDASLNTYLNETYYNSLTEETRGYIMTHMWRVGTPGNIKDTEDIVTDIQQESLYKWNGNIGLMNITDVLKTTTDTGCTSLKTAFNDMSKSVCSNNNWMWSRTDSSWTLSPGAGTSGIDVWLLYGEGHAFSGNSFASKGIRPTVYLIPNITLSGSGTSSDPYTINS